MSSHWHHGYHPNWCYQHGGLQEPALRLQGQGWEVSSGKLPSALSFTILVPRLVETDQRILWCQALPREYAALSWAFDMETPVPALIFKSTYFL